MIISGFIDSVKQEDKYILLIYTYIFLMPWNFLKGQMGALTIILFIWWLLKYKNELKSKLKTLLEFKPLVLLILFIIYTYISVLWSESFPNGFDYVNSFNKYYFILIPFIFTSLSLKQAEFAIKVFIFSFVSYSVFSLCIYLGFFDILDTNSNSANPKGIMAYSTSTQYMVIGSLASLFFALFAKSKQTKLIFLIMSLVCFLALFVNISRTSQLAFLLSIVTMFLIYYRLKIVQVKNIVAFFLLSALVVGLSWVVLEKSNTLKRYAPIYKEVSLVFENDTYRGSVGARLFFNKAGFEIFSDHPVLGIGPYDNWVEHKRMQKEAPNFHHHYVSSFHSTHLEILTAFGLVGYLLLFFAIVGLLYSLRSNKEYFYAGLSFFITTFYISFANGNFFKKPINYVLITAFVLLCVIAYKQRESQRSDIVK